MSTEQATAETEQLDENTIIEMRRSKLAARREGNTPAFPNDFKPTHHSTDLETQFGHLEKADLENQQEQTFQIAGRIVLKRVMGKASFITISDRYGKIQAYCRKSDLPEGVYNDFKTWDLGDIVGITGYLFKTNTGELTLYAQNIKLLTKSLRPLPDKFHGLSDQELRYRQRYVDLIVNDETRETFVRRAQIIDVVRDFLKRHGFMEVETPMMQTIAGGASARPFETHHNALDLDMFLRIAPELYLKRCIVGGFERVFEINRNFRNEGLSVRHNPEFTMVEFYQAYADYRELMDMTEVLLREIATTVLGTTVVHYQGEDYDLAAPFDRFTMLESILHYSDNITLAQLQDFDQAKALADSLGISLDEHMGLGKIQLEIFEKLVEHRLMKPTFITAYPAEVSPLARPNDEDPFITDRFEFFVGGRELANGFSELNDPEDQKARFLKQVEAKRAGDDEAMPFDADYIRALEYGMPPTAGEGIGIDRLVMFFTDQSSIRDVILFPHMRPE